MQLGRGDQRFELQGLEQGVTLPISLVAFKGDRRSRSVSTNLSTGNVSSCTLNENAMQDKHGRSQKTRPRKSEWRQGSGFL